MNLYQDTNDYIVHKYNDRQEWLSKRIKGIGGSDASALIGLNPWKDNNTLWKEKKGIIIPPDVSTKSQVKYGLEAEKYLRGLFELNHPEYEVQYIDNVILQSKKEPWMLYSPDALLFEKATGRCGILEIKTTEIMRSNQKEKWDNQIPTNYYVQVLHGLLVTVFDFVVLNAQLKSKWGDDLIITTKHYPFTREEKIDDLKWLFDNEKEQWTKYYIGNIEPNTILPSF